MPAKTNENQSVVTVEVELNRRLETLEKIAIGNKPSVYKYNCNQQKLLVMENIMFGRFGNQLMEITNGLWIARKTRRTLMLPSFISLKEFNTTLLSSLFCIIPYNKGIRKKSNDSLVIEPLDIFYMWEFLKNKEFINLRYIFNDPFEYDTSPNKREISPRIVDEISQLYVRVYSALWSHPIDSIYDSALWIIQHHLDNNLKYSSVHKRQLEGLCFTRLRDNIQLLQYSTSEIPMTHPEWLNGKQPLCDMTASFITETMKLNHKSIEETKLFIAHDGQDSVNDYDNISNSVFIQTIINQQQREGPQSRPPFHLHHIMFIELFLLIHSDLFIMNPASTFSWQVYVVRTALGLKSVPTLRDNIFDCTLGAVYSEKFNHNWVNWLTIENVAKRLNQHLQ